MNICPFCKYVNKPEAQVCAECNFDFKINNNIKALQMCKDYISRITNKKEIEAVQSFIKVLERETILCPKCGKTSIPKSLICQICEKELINFRIQEIEENIYLLKNLSKKVNEIYFDAINEAIKLFEKEIVNEKNMKKLKEIQD
jgi:hypothetical protein